MSDTEQPQPTMSLDLVEFVQDRRRDCLRALRACTESSPDYWRWQGHAELARQLLERIGAEVPK
jgi:hypothetical protein